MSLSLSIRCLVQILTKGQQALEGKDVKDLLLNVGSGGGAAAAPGGGAAAAPGAAGAAEEKEPEKEEGSLYPITPWSPARIYTNEIRETIREGGVRRGYGFRAVRLSTKKSFFASLGGFWGFLFELNKNKLTAFFSLCLALPYRAVLGSLRFISLQQRASFLESGWGKNLGLLGLLWSGLVWADSR